MEKFNDNFKPDADMLEALANIEGKVKPVVFNDSKQRSSRDE